MRVHLPQGRDLVHPGRTEEGPQMTQIRQIFADQPNLQIVTRHLPVAVLGRRFTDWAQR